MSKSGSSFRIFPAVSIWVAALALSAAIGMYTPQSLAASCPAAPTVMRAGSAFMAAAHSGTLASFSSALAQHTDVRGAALFALGQYRSELPPARQREYLTGAQSYIARFLMQHAGPFRESRNLVIESCRGNLVETSLDGRSRMLWRLSGGRVKDVQVSGVWLAIELRSKFGGILRQHRGNIDALLDYLAR
jgi:ABC-type transporter MlaC component